jgi:hypothetical protein
MKHQTVWWLEFLIYIFLFSFLGLSGCQSVWREPIPEGEIVYQGQEVSPYPWYRLGFIDANGENNKIIKLNRRFSKPVWSADGTIIYGLSMADGVYAGYPAYWDLQQGRFVKCSQDLPAFSQIQGSDNPANPYEVIVQDISVINLMDLSQCVESRTFVDYSFIDANMQGFSYSRSRQLLLYGLVENPQEHRTYKIICLNLNNGDETRLAEGINPALSPDGSHLAYIGLDGLYIIDLISDKATSRKLVDQPFFDPWRAGSPYNFVTVPSWSPDGNWLVYHRCDTLELCTMEEAQIYKINTNGGDEIPLTKGGEYPSWKP